MPSRIYAVLWIIWIAAFLVIELSALWSGRPQDTLSWYVWRLEGLHRGWTFARYFVAAFCLWLSAHMVWGVFK